MPHWLDDPPGFHGEYLLHRDSYAEHVIERQCERLQSLGSPPIPFADGEVERFIVEVNNRCVDYWATRRVFVRLTDEEVLSLRTHP
jgi:hypothetical protein